jgi:nitroimidazol reductase NimA-like FMN-containing flavoprotein (pyridoxamine 5'-phosphate oxidase superfamily)
MEYPAGSQNRVHRLAKKRAAYDLKTVHSIINESFVLHVSFIPDTADGFPAVIPMIGAMGNFEYPSADLDEPLDCYIHGYVSARMTNLARKAQEEQGRPGLPVCISAAKVDGLILALSAFTHSCNYRSATLFGHASLVTDEEEKLWALKLITNTLIPDRWDHTRLPPNANELVQTQILRVRVQSGSAKIRAGPPADDEADLASEDVRGRVWAGYIPVLEQLQQPVPSTYNKLEEVPQHIMDCREKFNEAAVAYNENLVKQVKEDLVKFGGV